MFYAENLYNWKNMNLFKNKCKIVSYNFYKYKIYVVLYIYIILLCCNLNLFYLTYLLEALLRF